MSSTHDIAELDNKGLRHFALATGAMVVGLFGLVLPWMLDAAFPYWPWYVLLALLVPAVVCPQALAPVYRYWMKFGLLLSRVTTPLILGIVFVLVFLPMGIALKLLRKDPMHRKLQADIKSYRRVRQKIDPSSMENPF